MILKQKKNPINFSQIDGKTILSRFQQFESMSNGKFSPKELLKFLTLENSNAMVLQSKEKLNPIEYFEFYDYFKKKYSKEPDYIIAIKKTWPNAPFVFQVAAAFINQSLRNGLTEEQKEDIEKLVDFIANMNADRVININLAGKVRQYRFQKNLNEGDRKTARENLKKIISDSCIVENAIIMLRCKSSEIAKEELCGFCVTYGKIRNISIDELRQSGEMEIVKNSEVNQNAKYCEAPIQFH